MPKPLYVELKVPSIGHSLVGYDLVSEGRNGDTTTLFFKRRVTEKAAAAPKKVARKKRTTTIPAPVPATEFPGGAA